MSDETPPNTLYTLKAATRPHIDWESLYDIAVASGRTRWVTTEEERVAACDEMLARCILELIDLARFAVLARVPSRTGECRRSIQTSSGTLIRLLDRALAAHTRTRPVDAAPTRKNVAFGANVYANDLKTYSSADAWPLPAAIDQAARHIAEALVAHTHDPAELHAHVTAASSELLVVFAAATAA
jgi:hypothetical protein